MSSPKVAPILSDYRPGLPHPILANNLGPLAELPGTWSGTGFNLIARPDFQGGNDIFLQLNLTRETLEFDAIAGSVPNRGSSQSDINLFGVNYLQKISDAATGGGLHIEPGLWVNIPATTAPVETASVARMATIPHGNSVLAEGTGFTVKTPVFSFTNTVPFPVGGPTPPQGTHNTFPEYNLSVPNKFRTAPLPAGITQDMVTNPVVALENAVKGQNITSTVVLNVATNASVPDGGGGVENIPFLTKNADASTVLSTFWIETVKHPNGTSFTQLQYVQTVLLNFLGLSWPHVSVATLTRV